MKEERRCKHKTNDRRCGPQTKRKCSFISGLALRFVHRCFGILRRRRWSRCPLEGQWSLASHQSPSTSGSPPQPAMRIGGGPRRPRSRLQNQLSMSGWVEGQHPLCTVEAPGDDVLFWPPGHETSRMRKRGSEVRRLNARALSCQRRSVVHETVRTGCNLAQKGPMRHRSDVRPAGESEGQDGARRELNAGIMQHRPRICVNECGCRVCIEVEEGEAVWIEPGCLCPKAPFIVRCNQHPVGREVVPPSVLPWDIPNRPIQIRCDGGVEKKADVSGAVVPQWSISVCDKKT